MAGKGSKAGRGGSGPPRRQPKAASGASGQRSSAQRSSAQRPLPPAREFLTPGASPRRRRVERASAPALVLLHRAPRPAVALAPLVLLALGVLLPPLVALVPLVLALLLVGWLSYLSWPAVRGGARATRVGVVLLVVAVAVYRITSG